MGELIALLAAIPLLTATAVMLLEVSLGAQPARQCEGPLNEDRASVAVVIPAHDEELSIGATLERLLDQEDGSRRFVVVADNCSDATAEIARAAGVEVIERVDDTRRGKGYALAFARSHLLANAPDCVIVLDADTVPVDGALARLAARSMHADRPVQAAYTIEASPEATPLRRFSAIAFYVKNVVRQLGISRAGAPAILTGSGMAFPWRIFATLPLETGHVTEDLMLGVSCSLAGDPPIFLPSARVLGQSSSEGGTGIQRRRWESGFFATAKAYAPRLIGTGIVRAQPGLIWLALHLATPPLLLLLALDLLMLAGLGLAAPFTGITVALILLTCLTGGLVIALFCATTRHGKRLSLSDLGSVPGYVVWKLALSIRALLRRETKWIRTSRE